jgi:DNA-binding NarL/FixJ family response regulator
MIIVTVGEANNGTAAIEQYRQLKPDVVVMDLRMPGMGGAEATTHIKRQFPSARIIVLTTYEGDEDIHRALEAGAQGYILKDAVRHRGGIEAGRPHQKSPGVVEHDQGAISKNSSTYRSIPD